MDVQHVVDTYHAVDPSTGFIQTTGNYAEAFTAERKRNFLDVYLANGLQFRNTCKQLGLSHHTINHHLSIDPQFKAEFTELRELYAERLESAQRDFAMDKKCFMDRAMQLRALLPEKYADQKSINTPQVVINISSTGEITSKRRDVIEAKLVSDDEIASGDRALIESAKITSDSGYPQAHDQKTT